MLLCPSRVVGYLVPVVCGLCPGADSTSAIGHSLGATVAPVTLLEPGKSDEEAPGA